MKYSFKNHKIEKKNNLIDFCLIRMEVSEEDEEEIVEELLDFWINNKRDGG